MAGRHRHATLMFTLDGSLLLLVTNAAAAAAAADAADDDDVDNVVDVVDVDLIIFILCV